MNDIIVNKIQSIQRCVARAREEYAADPEGFATNYRIQDAAVLNVVRACEQAIDLANHVIRTDRLGIPMSSGESFELLRHKAIIDAGLSDRLQKMVHFRNIAVHQYQRMDLNIVASVILTGLDDLVHLGDCILKHTQGEFS